MAGTGVAYPADAASTGLQFNANQGRNAFSAAMAGATASRPLGGLTGCRPGTPTNTITATSTTWTMNPNGFAGYIDLEASVTNSGYFFSFSGTITGSVVAAGGSARTDIVYVQINDSNISDGSTGAPRVVIDYISNYPTTAIPARSFAIAQINVPATGGGSPTVTWIAPYCAAAGGTLYANTASQLNAITSAPAFQRAITYDTGNEWQFVGSTWVPVRAHGEYSYAVSFANASLTTFNNTPVFQTSSSSGNATSVLTATTSGFTATYAGVYTITCTMQLGVTPTGRTFFSVTSGGVEYRNATTEDQSSMTAEFYAAAGASIAFSIFQTTGAARLIQGRINVSFKPLQ